MVDATETPEPARPGKPGRQWAWPAGATVAVAAAILLRAVSLDQRQMFKDEGASWLPSSLSRPNPISHTMQDVYPPLYALVLHFWMIAFGDSVTTLRLLSILLGLAFAVAAVRLGHAAHESRPHPRPADPGRPAAARCRPGGYVNLLRGRAAAVSAVGDDRFLAWTLTFALALIPLAWLCAQFPRCGTSTPSATSCRLSRSR